MKRGMWIGSVVVGVIALMLAEAEAQTVIDSGVDTKIQGHAPFDFFGQDELWGFDTEEDGGLDIDTPEQGLIRFDIPQDVLDLVAATPQPVALLNLFVKDPGSNGAVHRMLETWDDTFVWDDFFSTPLGGVVPGINALETPTTQTGTPGDETAFSLDVTSDVVAWASGEPNHGWAFIPGGTDGFDVASFDYLDIDAELPTLTLASLHGSPIKRAFAPDTDKGHVWKYLDTLSETDDYPPGWNTPSFDDSSWKTGPAIFGNGTISRSADLNDQVLDSEPDPDELPFGTQLLTSRSSETPNFPRVTDLFRTTFNVSSIDDIEGLSLDVMVDDGAIIYVNGTEVARDGYDADADVTIDGRTRRGIREGIYRDTLVFFDDIGGNPLVEGENTLAVEVHQSRAADVDRAFDLGLTLLGSLGTGPPPEPETPLQAGDADQNLDFNQLDIVRISIAGKYLSGQPATWGEGDWDGAPGGSPGSPPAGNGFFDQLDIVAALSNGLYLQGPYGALSATEGNPDDEQTSLVYDAGTGELSVDAPASTQLTSIFVTSGGNLFVGDKPPVLDGPFDSFAPDNIFKSTIGSSFGDSSFGNVLPAALSREDVVADLSASGSLAGGGGLGDVDLIYIPEPTSLLLAVMAFIGIFAARRRLQE